MDEEQDLSNQELLQKQSVDLDKISWHLHTLTTEFQSLKKFQEKQLNNQTDSLRTIAKAAQLWYVLTIIGLILSCVIPFMLYSIYGVSILVILKSVFE